MLSRKYLFVVSLVIWLLFPTGPGVGGQGIPVATVVVHAGPYTRYNTPVSMLAEGIIPGKKELLNLIQVDGSERIPIPCQLEAGTQRRLWWIITDTMYAGETRRYELFTGKTTNWDLVRVTVNDKDLTIFNGDKPVLRYHHVPVPLPDGVDSAFTRSAFIHPLWAPSGDILTRINPPDHYHHYGIWNPWTRTRFEGREVDFWNLGDRKGTVRFKSYASLTQGSVYGGFRALHDHVDLSAPEGEKTALSEEWDIRVWNIGKEGDEYWLLDFTSLLQCATPDTVTLEQYRYGGGIGFRATEDWTNLNSYFLTSEGKTRKDGDGTRATWCNVYGKSEGKTSGILFLSYSQNRNHPEPMRIWPEDNRDVFFEFCPIRNKKWLLEPGKTYVLRYRMYIYNGTISVEEAERIWRDFAEPPLVELLKAEK